jgi:3D (Asp-Asp-Asp) domain-containing protein
VTLHEGSLQSTFYTTQPTLGAALAGQGLTLFAEDNVLPNVETPLTPGLNIYLQRATPVTLTVDGRSLPIRTHQETVGEVVAAAGIGLMGQDFTRPAADQRLTAQDTIEVVRVQETLEVDHEFISFETTWIADESMELDRQEIRQPGVTGVIKTRTRIRLENGQEVWREVEDKWLDQEARERVIAYGTEIVIRTLDTPDGPVEYWRKIPMLATAYNAAASGKEFDHPRYGITRCGLTAGYGVVAVDTKVIPLQTDLYIPEYGLAVAGDTGGLIVGKHIDLGYGDDQPLPIIYEWRNVYVLTPVPPASRIRYVLPQWPQRE